MNEPMVMQCRICKKLYEFFSHMVGDQSVCPSCRRKTKENTYGKGWKSGYYV